MSHEIVREKSLGKKATKKKKKKKKTKKKKEKKTTSVPALVGRARDVELLPAAVALAELVVLFVWHDVLLDLGHVRERGELGRVGVDDVHAAIVVWRKRRERRVVVEHVGDLGAAIVPQLELHRRRVRARQPVQLLLEGADRHRPLKALLVGDREHTVRNRQVHEASFVHGLFQI
jgi:hypothetical protein